MAAAGVPMRTLQEWMGHQDIKTTMIYVDYAPSENEGAMVQAAFARDEAASESTDQEARPGGSGSAVNGHDRSLNTSELNA
jgi:hypothetical protein